MTKPERDRISSTQLWENYRRIRRGIIGGSRLEATLRQDLDWLMEVRQRGTLSEIELLFARESIGAIYEGFSETVSALESLIRIAESNDILDHTEKVIELVCDTVKDDPTRTKIVNGLLLNGGVRHYLEGIHKRYSLKEKAYQEAMENLVQEGASALPDVVDQLTINLDNLTEQELKQYWKKKLEETRCIGGSLLFTSVGWELCTRYPKIAKELGVDCPHIDFFFEPTDWAVAALIVAGAIILIVAIAYTCEN